MSKKGQHQSKPLAHSKPRGHEQSEGANDPSKSVEITTGSYKKHETYDAQARRHEDPSKAGQHQKNEWKDDLQRPDDMKRRARDSDITHGRSGSDSNASAATKGR
jgi:hypothetical protein